MNTEVLIHPAWCDGHTCTAATDRGEHRSQPLAWDTDAGSITATRIRVGAHDDQLELVTVVTLSTDPQTSREQTRHLIGRTYLAALAGLQLTDLDRPHTSKGNR